MSQQSELRYLTCMRGIAAVWVAFHHAGTGLYKMTIPDNEIIARFIHRGWLAVDLFFILSGFILAYSYFQKSRNGNWVSDFLVKRFARVYPAHLFTLFLFAAVMLLAMFTGSLGDNASRYSIEEFLAQTFLIHGIGIYEPTGWNVISWSISSEALAYLCFPFLLYPFRKLWPPRMNMFIIMLILSFTIWLAWEFNGGSKFMLGFEYTWVRVLSEFTMGIALFQIFTHLKKSFFYIIPLLFATTGVILQGLVENSFYDFMYLVYFMLIILSLALIPGDKKIPGFTFLGEVSYAFYLIHPVSILVLNQVIRRSMFLQENYFFTITLFLSATIFASYLVYRMVEQKGRDFVLFHYKNLLNYKSNRPFASGWNKIFRI